MCSTVYVYLLYCVGFAVFTLGAGLLAWSKYSEGPATGHLDTGFCLDAGLLAWNQYSDGPATGHLDKDFSLDAGLLAWSQYSEGPATGHLDTWFLGFPVPKNKCWDGSQNNNNNNNNELGVTIREVLRPATSTKVFLGFPVSISKCWDGSQHSKLTLHASHVALPT